MRTGQAQVARFVRATECQWYEVIDVIRLQFLVADVAPITLRRADRFDVGRGK